jgi:hypothetical protein
MSDRTPYTYFVYHKPTGLKYYGSKYGKGANPDMFWKPGGYFTSSLKVKKLLKEYGIDSFKAEVRKVFENPDQALNYEYRFLKKVRALDKIEWLNENLGGEKFRNVGPASEKALASQRKKKQTSKGNAKRSATLKGRVFTDETRKKMSEVQKNRSVEKETERRNKIRQHALGRGHNDETKAKLSVIVSESRWVNNGIDNKKIHVTEVGALIAEGWVCGRLFQTVTCPHCGATGVKHNIVRKHFDKCKHKGKKNDSMGRSTKRNDSGLR